VIVDLIIPALDEEGAIGGVVAAFLATGRIRRVVVADNGSGDRTAERARAAGAEVVHEPERGYGAACLKALAHLAADPPEAVLFADGDGSDEPAALGALLAALERAELVIGSRVLGRAEPGALTLAQRVGNAIATTAIRLRYRVPATDLGPFRAIRWAALQRLALRDRNWGWTIEMQLKAARAGLRIAEVPVRARVRRAGRSKVSGTVRGATMAGITILGLLARHALAR
jgi:glycosyltransferase involved in cell wall biosynthesis